MSNETAKDRQARESIESLARQLEEERAERKRFENLFAATCETLGRVKRELGMPDAAIGTEPEQAAALRQERDALAAHVVCYRMAYVELTNSVEFADNGEAYYVAGGNLMLEFDAIASATPATSLARLKSEWQAEGALAIRHLTQGDDWEDDDLRAVIDDYVAELRRQAEGASHD